MALFGLFLVSSSAYSEQRTAGRSVAANCKCEMRYGLHPMHKEYTPLISNLNRTDKRAAAQNTSSASPPLLGQEWEPGMWSGGWTPQTAVRKFFEGRIFERQYMRYGQVPVVELGPAFYMLSDLDQQRTLKLLTDQSAVFSQGYRQVELIDWSTHDAVGVFTLQGLSLL